MNNVSPSHMPIRAYSQPSRRAMISSFRKLAREALRAFGLKDARLKFQALADNALFRVYESPKDVRQVADSPFEPGQYLLRIHDSIGQNTKAIELEMAWLTALRKDTGLPVPEPVRSLDGRFLVRQSTDGLAEPHNCTLLRWLRGRLAGTHIRPKHFEAQGEIMAQLHNHASQWPVPKGLTKRTFDYRGLFIDDAGAGLSNGEAWSLLSVDLKRAYEEVSQRVKRVMDEWGKNRHVYGLIHADCGVDHNVLFWKGKPRVIDFDDSGFGYYVYDLAIALEHCWAEPEYDRYLSSLIRGYRRWRSLPDEQLAAMDLFRAAFYVQLGLWTVAVDKLYPDSTRRRARHEKWLGYGMEFIGRVLAKSATQ